MTDQYATFDDDFRPTAIRRKEDDGSLSDWQFLYIVAPGGRIVEAYGKTFDEGLAAFEKELGEKVYSGDVHIFDHDVPESVIEQYEWHP
ncbi:hypothetical protein J7426_01585 [Tropicibacter sp. R16_0]|uniref:hypothetical protein n=1 Tax=Tropicibacter sp. R16_0 TaxID=2821102 RepID=UPI001ADD2BD4|nr:hypothetical protein [Tropicibacter sp. R16_0]MBO9448929.1 hypothetical protein [Tropicibacter sp. R16_0]